MKKYSNITYYILAFAIIDLLYVIFVPEFPPVKKPFELAFLRVVFYLNHYSIVAVLSFILFSKTKLELDRIALFGLGIYSVSKLIFYLFLINKDLPTYVDALNNKCIDVVFSLLLWSLSITIYYYKFNIRKLWTGFAGRSRVES